MSAAIKKSTLFIALLCVFFSSCTESNTSNKIVGSYIQSYDPSVSTKTTCSISHIKEKTYGLKFITIKENGESGEVYHEGTLNTTERILTFDMNFAVGNLQFDENYKTAYFLENKTVTFTKK